MPPDAADPHNAAPSGDNSRSLSLGNPIASTEKQYKALAKRCVTGDL